MEKEIYEFLRLIGFYDKEIDSIEDRNDNVVYLNLIDVKKIINEIKHIVTDIEQIKNIFITNEYLITSNVKDIKNLKNYYMFNLKLKNEEIKEMLIKNPYLLSIEFTKLKEKIYFLKEKKHDIKEINNILKNNPNLVNFEILEIEKILKTS